MSKRVLILVLCLVGWTGATVLGQTASDLASSEASDFLGSWKLAMEIQGNPVEMQLVISDLEGKTGARLTSQRNPEGTDITDIRRDSDNLHLSWPRDFQGQEMTLNMVLARTESGLTGTFGDSNGLFSADVTGTGEDRAEASGQAAEGEEASGGEEAEVADSQQSRRRRIGPSAAKMDLEGGEVQVKYDPIPADDEVLSDLAALSAGEVAHWTKGRAIKLMTDHSLDFSGTVLEYGNAAENYPGVYSLWPKKTAKGWSLVFNQDADIWGTMREAARDVGESPAEYQKRDEVAPTLAVELEPSDDGGTLTLHWGPHAWTASFTSRP